MEEAGNLDSERIPRRYGNYWACAGEGNYIRLTTAEQHPPENSPAFPDPSGMTSEAGETLLNIQCQKWQLQGLRRV